MLVSRSMTSDDGVFIPFSNNLFFAPALRWITFPCCFSRSKSAKGWSTGCIKIFRMFFFLCCWYCVNFPWVSEVEIEIQVCSSYKNKLHVYCYLNLACYYLFLSHCMTSNVISLFSKFGYDCRSCVYVYCRVLFQYTVSAWKSTLLIVFGIWNIIYWGPQSQQPMNFCYIIYGYFNFGFGPVCLVKLSSVRRG